MNFSLKYIILIGFLFVLAPALLLLSYTDYSKAKQDLEDNFDFMVNQTAENVTGAYDLVEVGYRILSLSLENKCQRRTKTAPVAGATVHHLADFGRSKSAPFFGM